MSDKYLVKVLSSLALDLANKFKDLSPARMEQLDPYMPIFSSAIEEHEGKIPDESLVAMFYLLSHYYHFQGRPDLALEWLEKGLNHTGERFGDTHDYYLGILGLIGTTYNAIEQYKKELTTALKGITFIRKSRAKLVKEAYYSYFTAYLYTVACAYLNLSEYKKAKKVFDKVLPLMIREFGEESPRGEGTIYSQLGSLYKSLKDLKKSETYYKKALYLALKSLTVEQKHPEYTTSVLAGLGEIYLIKGQLREAEMYIKNAYELTKKLKGEVHPETIPCIDLLITLTCEKEEYQEVKALLEKREEIVEKCRNFRYTEDDYASDFYFLNNLGLLHFKKGKYSAAYNFYSQALKSSLNKSGERCKEAALLYNNIAKLYCAQGRYEEAKPLYEKAIAIALDVLGDEDFLTLKFQSNYRDLIAFIESCAIEDY